MAVSETAVADLDHLVLGAPELDAAVETLERALGVRARPGGRHPAFGTHNALLALGGRAYLEVMAPDPAAPAASGPLPFGVAALRRPRLVAWAVRCEAIAQRVAAARGDGYDPGEPRAGERRAPDGQVLRWRMTPGGRDGGVVPFLIEWGNTPHPAATAPGGVALVSLSLEHPEPDAIASRLRALQVRVAVARAAAPCLVAVVEGPRGRLELR